MTQQKPVLVRSGNAPDNGHLCLWGMEITRRRPRGQSGGTARLTAGRDSTRPMPPLGDRNPAAIKPIWCERPQVSGHVCRQPHPVSPRRSPGEPGRWPTICPSPCPSPAAGDRSLTAAGHRSRAHTGLDVAPGLYKYTG